MEFIAETIADLSPSLTLSITSQAKQMREDGIDVCNLGAGEPDFDTPQHIKNAAIDALQDGQTKYTAVAGLKALREGIAKKFKDENQIDYAPEEIVVNCGAKHSCFNAIMACCDAGDEVIIPSPYWTSYPEMVNAVGAKPVFVETKQENNWKITPEEFDNSMTGSTKMIIINSPNNPSGSIFNFGELNKIASVLRKYPEIFVLSDEIYEHINYGVKHVSFASIAGMYERTITVNGIAKAFAMTGWRIGYLGAPEWIAKACTKLQGQVTSGANCIAQKATIKALTESPKKINYMIEEFQERRNMIIKLLSEIKGFKLNNPDGAFYVFPDISYYFGKEIAGKIITSASDFAMIILEKAHVATVTGDAFGCPKNIRISYAASQENIKEAVNRIKNLLN